MKARKPDGSRWFTPSTAELMDHWLQQPELLNWLACTIILDPDPERIAEQLWPLDECRDGCRFSRGHPGRCANEDPVTDALLRVALNTIETHWVRITRSIQLDCSQLRGWTVAELLERAKRHHN